MRGEGGERIGKEMMAGREERGGIGAGEREGEGERTSRRAEKTKAQ